VVWTDQLEPFHRSASVANVPAVFVNEPTAVHALADVHDTALGELLLAPGGAGML
jgi:hypothetical protein